MADPKTKKDKNGNILGWQIRAPRITQDRKFSFYCAKSRGYDRGEASRICNLLTDCENDLTRRGLIRQETVDEIAERFPVLRDKLIKLGIFDSAPFLTLGPLVERYLNAKTPLVKEQTVSQVRRNLARLSKYFGVDKPIAEITRDDARAFDAGLNKKINSGSMKLTTRNRTITDVKSLFEWALDNLDSDELTRNPFHGLKGGSTTSDKDVVVMPETTARQILDILSSLDGRENRNPLEWRVWFLLGYRQGLRVESEAPELKWEFIDFGDGDNMGTILIKSVKTSKKGNSTKWRRMPLFDETAQALQELKESLKASGAFSMWVFSDWWRHGDTKTRGVRAEGTYCRILKKNGLFSSRPVQILRQTASNRIRDEWGPDYESIWLGHSKKIASDAYLDNKIPKNILAKKPNWEIIEV